MDEPRFDALARSLVLPCRRSLLAALATAIGAALFGDDANDEALAKRNKRKRSRRKQVAEKPSASRDRLGAEGRKKKKKRKKPAAIAPPTADCTPTCTSKNCGASDGCGGACATGSCPDGQVCQHGQCVLLCDAGFTLCGSQCVNTQTNASHCGGCNQPCAVQDPETCGTTGQCVSGDCVRYRSSTVCNQPHCEQSFWSIFGFQCDGDGSCQWSGFEDCRPGRCDSRTGLCAPSCRADSECFSDWCDNGTCRYKPNGMTCSHPDQCNSSYCVDGVCCNTECLPPQNAQRSCTGGTCAISCLPDYRNCNNNMALDGCETNVTQNLDHCGACNAPCAGSCADGSGHFECENGICSCTH